MRALAAWPPVQVCLRRFASCARCSRENFWVSEGVHQADDRGTVYTRYWPPIDEVHTVGVYTNERDKVGEGGVAGVSGAWAGGGGWLPWQNTESPP